MIKQFIPQEACLKCRGCCRFSQEDSAWVPHLLNEELETFLKQGIPSSLISPHKHIRVASFQKENTFMCSLFNPEENKCKIYDFRPFECQLYPFLINRKARGIFLAVDLKCLFIGQTIKTDEFKQYALYLTGLLKSSPYQEILKNNPQILQDYTEVLDLSEL